MAVYVLLAFDNDEDARTLVQDMLEYPDRNILTPAQENDVHATVRGVWKKPTVFCECRVERAVKGKTTSGWTRGKKYGWWVCAKCGKPAEAWARGDSWYTALGTNLIPQCEIAPEYRPAGWESPAEWRFVLNPPF